MMSALIRGSATIAVFLGVFTMNSWIAAQEFGGNPKQGQAVYQQHCLRCHGAAGDGMGPEAGDLILPPANFQSLKSRSKTDFELLTTISQGRQFTPMHGWFGRLTDQDMLDVLSYIRLLAPFYPLS